MFYNRTKIKAKVSKDENMLWVTSREWMRCKSTSETFKFVEAKDNTQSETCHKCVFKRVTCNDKLHFPCGVGTFIRKDGRMGRFEEC